MCLRARDVVPLLAALLPLGCGVGVGAGGVSPDPRVNAATANGPHGGQAVPLPGDQGFAEILIEQGAKKAPPRFAVYFLAPDLKGPLPAKPTEVRAKLITAEGESSVSLSPDPKRDDKTGAGRYTSPPGKFDADEYTGELTAVIDGQSFTRPFALR